MNQSLGLILGVGVLYTLVFKGLALVRREGLAYQFIWEGLSFTGLVLAVMAGGNVALHPFYFLILLYLFTMRVRLLVELGNQLSRWGRPQDALNVYQIALRCWPDPLTRGLALINVGATYLTCHQPDRTIAVLEPLQARLRHMRAAQYLVGCGYNLGMAYRRVGRRTEALQQFQEIAEQTPLSQYGHLAEIAYKATLQEPVPPEP